MLRDLDLCSARRAHTLPGNEHSRGNLEDDLCNSNIFARLNLAESGRRFLAQHTVHCKKSRRTFRCPFKEYLFYSVEGP
jgi:hypothetical protein